MPVRFAFGLLNAIRRLNHGVPLIRTGEVSAGIWYTSRVPEVAAFIDVVAVIDALSVSVSVVPAGVEDVKPSVPRPGEPAGSFWVTGLAAGSGDSLYGVGFALQQTRFAAAPLATFCPAVAASAAPWSTRCVESGMSSMNRDVLVIVPLAFVCGIVSWKPTWNGDVSAKV